MLGVPLSIQFLKKLVLKIKSSIQDPNGFNDKNPRLAHNFPTWLSNILFANFYKSSLITTKPLRAFFKLNNEDFIIYMSRLYLTNYCTKTVFID
jgi:hypothetical protein